MQTSTSTEGHRPHVALALQGGGAIGAFQAGVLEALDTAGVHIDACCGASIGAINAALFFGNEPACRIERLRAFWDAISVPDGLSHAVSAGWLLPFIDDSTMRRALAEAEQGYAMIAGLPGFFSRRLVVPVLRGNGNPANASVFDMQPLLRTLAALCDFDRLNASSTRVSVVATHVASGDAHFFDNRDTRLDVTRIAAAVVCAREGRRRMVLGRFAVRGPAAEAHRRNGARGQTDGRAARGSLERRRRRSGQHD
ncbi:patatin-like phospholipase family protein [Burkholderia multivorans]|nr:patatin-like phospholipase family protein [Burkholderia multivorans]